jgi:hypothetical protein
MRRMIFLISFSWFSYCLYAQESAIKRFTIAKSRVNITYFNSSNKKKFKLHSRKNTGKRFFEDSSTRFFIDPFSNTRADTLIRTEIIKKVKQYYNLEKSYDRQTYGEPIEVVGVLVIVNTLGDISNFGFTCGTNVEGFEDEILEVMPKVKNQVKLPVYKENGIPFCYVYTFFICSTDMSHE